jgi:phosphomevalonate kinase
MLLSASAPGKVLICGGYLVVEAPNVGLSIGVTARFRTTLNSFEPTEGSDVAVRVRSPQFKAVFEFVALVNAERVELKQTSGRESPFLFYGVLTSLAFIRSFGEIPAARLELTLEADNDFYSQRNYLESKGEKVTAASLRTVPAFNELVGEVSKTGLGSSAALTSSFVACLCHGVVANVPALQERKESIVDVEAIHRIAQAAHSVAQGKIGSGFDVHTAVYGTNVYVRFPPTRVDVLMAANQPTSFTIEQVRSCVDLSTEWVPARRTTAHGLPRGINLMLADIHQGGSATPGMVAKIMSWRKSVKDQPGNLWDTLARANEAYLATIAELHSIATEASSDYDATIGVLRGLNAADWGKAEGVNTTVLQALIKFRDGAAQTRALLRCVGEAAEVEVEPKVLSPLLDATGALPGVVAAGCPGAGGYDAVFALVVGGETEMAAVEGFWESSPAGLEVCPLLVREDPHGGLVVDIA